MWHFLTEVAWFGVAAGIVYLGLAVLILGARAALWVIDWLVAFAEGGE